ncbi:hypothetical protein EIN_458480, partial [Entamoeba invadens IP1]
LLWGSTIFNNKGEPIAKPKGVVDLKTSVTIEDLTITNIKSGSVIVPEHAKNISVYNTSADVVFGNCHPIKIIVSNYKGKKINVPNDCLKYVSTTNALDKIDFGLKLTKSYALIVDMAKLTTCVINENIPNKFVIQQGDKTSNEFYAKSLTLNIVDGMNECVVGGFQSIVDISKLSFYKSIFVNMDTSNPSIIIGNQNNVSFNCGMFDEIITGDVEEINFNAGVSVNKLVMNNINTFNFKRVNIKEVVANKIKKFGGSKKALKKLTIKEK